MKIPVFSHSRESGNLQLSAENSNKISITSWEIQESNLPQLYR
ncbi:MAG: hypothetical protein OXJ52_09835 [Oligoflexia bacterium]|nr:hypothetical protein [Oligoflexia bacterium]